VKEKKTLWKNKKVSVVFPTYNEKESIRRVIEEFFATGLVDEVIVVNNNAAEGTKEEVEKTRAIQVFETQQGYGHAMQRGMRESTGDFIILSEPDGTFSGKDTIKLLAYSDDAEVVLGSRTVPKLIEYEANMGTFMRMGNWAVAKLLEFLFLTYIITDVGCSMKLIKRSAYEKIKDKFTVGTSHFNAELLCLIIVQDIKFIEIPVKYQQREGRSMVTGDPFITVGVCLRMLGVIFKYRFLHFFTNKHKIKRP
jgi:glycosyltransferase involved in cell wall biosynthesis